jgi:hypothetical protein
LPKPIPGPIATPQSPPVEDANLHAGRTKKIVGGALVGGGVALVATGVYFGHRASSLSGEITRACFDGCDWAIYGPKHAAGQSAERLQYVFDGLGAATLIGGGVLYWLGHREAASSIALVPQPKGAAIAWSGTW